MDDTKTLNYLLFCLLGVMFIVFLYTMAYSCSIYDASPIGLTAAII